MAQQNLLGLMQHHLHRTNYTCRVIHDNRSSDYLMQRYFIYSSRQGKIFVNHTAWSLFTQNDVSSRCTLMCHNDITLYLCDDVMTLLVYLVTFLCMVAYLGWLILSRISQFSFDVFQGKDIDLDVQLFGVYSDYVTLHHYVKINSFAISSTSNASLLSLYHASLLPIDTAVRNRLRK